MPRRQLLLQRGRCFRHNEQMDTPLPPSRAALRAEGRAARARTRRRALARLGTSRRDPLGIIAQQNAARDPDLLALRTERMAQTAFGFYRGTAALMAADLADSPHSGILVPSCGDAHVSNFGFYASAQRRLVFDLNDFDEAAWAPWEWDVKRLVTSVIVGGAASDRSAAVIDLAARRAVRTYLGAIRRAAEQSPVRRYFTHFDIEASRALLPGAARRAIRGAIRHAARRTGERAVQRLTEVDADGRRRIVLREPVSMPVSAEIRGRVSALVTEYQRSATQDIALLMSHFALIDVARRVVGVGSVGTRCYLALLQDGDGNALLMQPKEAGQSVLVEFGRMPQPPALADLIAASGEGARVVAMQRILQALSDPFLGHLRGPERDFYVRQFHDMKGGIDVEDLDDDPFVTYAEACAAVLARAHSQSRNVAQIAGYVGGGRAVTDAIVAWSYDYAALSRRDYEAFLAT